MAAVSDRLSRAIPFNALKPFDRHRFADLVAALPRAGSSRPSSPHQSPGHASLANKALPSPAGLRPANRLNQILPDPGIPLRFNPSAARASEGVAENIATAFGLITPDYDAIRAEHASALKRMAEAFESSLNGKATEMHFQRIVGALVGSAVGAGRFYSTTVGEARAAAARAADGGDDEHGTPIGFESKAQRTRELQPRWRCRPTPSSPPPTARSTPTRI
jgi:hypothetical protein